jgi:hypothetical protein
MTGHKLPSREGTLVFRLRQAMLSSAFFFAKLIICAPSFGQGGVYGPPSLPRHDTADRESYVFRITFREKRISSAVRTLQSLTAIEAACPDRILRFALAIVKTHCHRWGPHLGRKGSATDSVYDLSLANLGQSLRTEGYKCQVITS